VHEIIEHYEMYVFLTRKGVILSKITIHKCMMNLHN